jgi:hypothetical protein
MTIVDLNNLGYRDEPFVLANDVAQVFYVKHMSSKLKNRKHKAKNTSYNEPKCHIVISGKRNIVGVEDKTDMSEDYNKFDEIPPFRMNMVKMLHRYDRSDPNQGTYAKEGSWPPRHFRSPYVLNMPIYGTHVRWSSIYCSFGLKAMKHRT